MVVYIILYIFILLSYRFGKDDEKWAYFILFALCFLAFFRGVNVGTDTWGYSMNFIMIEDNPSTWSYEIPVEDGFNYFMLYFKKYLSNNPQNCLGFAAFIYIFGFFLYAQKYSKDIVLSLVVFTLYSQYLLCYNIVRQCFALGLVFFVIYFIDIRFLNIKKNVLLSGFIILIGYFIHPAVYISLVVLSFGTSFSRLLMKRKVIVSLILFSYILFYFKMILPYVTNSLDWLGVTGKLYSYMAKNVQRGEESGYSLLKLSIICCFQIYTIVISRNCHSIFLYLSSLAVVFLNIFGIIVVELVRVYECLMCLGIVSYIQVFHERRRFYYFSRFYETMLFIYCTVLYFNIIFKNYGRIIPYNFR